MSTPKGYPSQEKEDRLKAQFSTVSPAGLSKFALDVRDVGTVYSVGSDAVEANSTTSVINATAHAARKGDRVRFTSGALQGIEADVWEVSTNAITLGQTMPSAPVAAVTFDILRPVSLTVGSDGTITTTVAPSPLIFTRNGVDQEVTEDTVTPANNRPLPVSIMGASGSVTITAGNLEVALDSASDSVAAVQSGTWTVDVGTSALPTGAATEATLSTINGKVTAVDTGNVTVASSALPTGAATESTLSTLNGKVTAVDTGNVTVASSALPTGAATEATLASLDGKVTAVDTGNVTIVAELAIQPDANTSDNTKVVSGYDNSGAAYHALNVDSSGQLNVNVNDFTDIVDFLDTNPVLDTSGTNIPASASNPVQVVASLAVNVKKIRVNDTTGKFIGVYTGAALSEVLQAVIGPGMDDYIQVRMNAGERVSLRHMSNSAISSGELLIQFTG